MPLRAGRLRHQCRFERMDTTPDQYGAASGVWTAVASVWGGLSLETASESVEAGRLQGGASGVLTVRSTPATKAITTADRVVIDGATYAIRSIVNPDGRGAQLIMSVDTGGADGA